MQVVAITTKNPFETLANVFAALAEASEQRKQTQLTLGELIDDLGKADPKALVKFDDGRSPEEPHSYKGYYEDLAFQPRNIEITAGQFLEVAKACNGAVYRGDHGGDYDMGLDTPLWEANIGSTGRSIVRVEISDQVTLITEGDEDCSEEGAHCWDSELGEDRSDSGSE